MNILNYEDWRQEEARGFIRETMYEQNFVQNVKAVFEMLKPELKKDGKQWCCIWGAMPENYIAGFGDTPQKAIYDFYNSYLNEKP